MKNEEMLSVTQFGEAVGMTRQAVRLAIASGRVEAVRIGFYWSIPFRETLRFKKRVYVRKPKRGKK